MLQRLWKANLKGDGKVPYKSWLEILRISLLMEDYKEFFSNAIGYKTVMKVWADELAELWKNVSLNQK
jgi:hypothetical protein